MQAGLEVNSNNGFDQPTKSAPIVARANFVQFAPRQRMSFARLKSRLLIHCRSGRGRIDVNGQSIDIERGQLIWLPWACRVSYEGDASDPFFIAGIHIIPWAKPGSPVVREASHNPDDPWDHNPNHADVRPMPVDGPMWASLVTDHALSALIDYTIRRCRHLDTPESLLRQLAELLWDELVLFFSSPPDNTKSLPVEMQRVIQFIDDHLAQPMSLDDLAEFADRGLSWMHRNFSQWLDMTPARYIMTRRIEQAKELLAVTTLPIGQVGQRVGVPDRYYFSKLFKAEVGMTPTQYRARSSLM